MHNKIDSLLHLVCDVSSRCLHPSLGKSMLVTVSGETPLEIIHEILVSMGYARLGSHGDPDEEPRDQIYEIWRERGSHQGTEADENLTHLRYCLSHGIYPLDADKDGKFAEVEFVSVTTGARHASESSQAGSGEGRPKVFWSITMHFPAVRGNPLSTCPSFSPGAATTASDEKKSAFISFDEQLQTKAELAGQDDWRATLTEPHYAPNHYVDDSMSGLVKCIYTEIHRMYQLVQRIDSELGLPLRARLSLQSSVLGRAYKTVQKFIESFPSAFGGDQKVMGGDAWQLGCLCFFRGGFLRECLASSFPFCL